MAQKSALILLLITLLVTGGWHWFEPAARRVAKGVDAYRKGQFDQALDAFVSAKGITPESGQLRYNTAAALLSMSKHKEALEELSQIDDGALVGPAGLHYNKGNAQFHLQNFQQALEEFRESLLADPDDFSAKRNYELTLKKIKEQQQKDQQSGSKDSENSDEDKQQEDQQKEEPHKDTMQYLNQNEREQQKKQRQKQAVMLGREKDW